MVKFSGKHLKPKERAFIRAFVNFVLEKFVGEKVAKQTNVTIRILNLKNCPKAEREALRKYKAWMNKNSKFSFTVTIHARMFNSQRDFFERMQPFLECLGHELVHVKQYLNGETRDYINGDVWFKGQRFENWDEGENYWFSPWELEAYGYEQALFEVFKLRYKAPDK